MKLSEFKGEKGLEIAAKLINPIFKLTTNAAVREARNAEGATVNSVLAAMLTAEPKATFELYAILNEKSVDEYIEAATAATMLHQIIETFMDDDLMVLFGLRARNTATE